MRNILITGATGGLGNNLVQLLLVHEDVHLFILLKQNINRKLSSESFFQKIFKERWCNFKGRVKFFTGKIESKDLGLNNNDRDYLYHTINEIYHCAAVTGFNLSSDIVNMINVEGTRNVLNFSLKCINLNKFNYISSTFVLGNKVHVLRESEFDLNQNFNNAYEKSKFEAEKIVRKYIPIIPITIFRPSVITGNFTNGNIVNFKLIYEAIRLFSKNLVDEFPGRKTTEQNLIPADVAAKQIYLLSQFGQIKKTYHIISPNSVNCYKLLKLASKYFGYKNPKWIKPEDFDIKKVSPVKRALISPFLPYFDYMGSCASAETLKELLRLNYSPPRINNLYFNKMFKFCIETGFIKSKSLKRNL